MDELERKYRDLTLELSKRHPKVEGILNDIRRVLNTVGDQSDLDLIITILGFEVLDERFDIIIPEKN